MATTQLDTFSTAGAFTYTIPSWAYKIDVIVLGGGKGGRSGGSGFNNGGGGDNGSFSSATITRGTTIGWGVTSITGTVGSGGAGGTGGASGVGGNGVASTATATGWAGISGSGGTVDFQGSTATGQAAGTLSYNGNSYVGGAAQTTLGNIGNAPGGGGSGGAGNFIGGNDGGAGGAGRVWIFAYSQFADSTSSIATTLSSAGKLAAYGSLTTNITAASSPSSVTSKGVTASSPITATIASVGLRDVPSSTTQSETATTTSAGLRNAIVNGPASISVSVSSASRQASVGQPSLSATATSSPYGVISATLASTQSISVTTPLVSRWQALFSASQAINFSFPTIALRDIPSALSLPVTATISTVANASFKSPAVDTLVTDTLSSAARLLAVGSTTSSISCALTADSHRLARVDVAQPITATRNSVVCWDANFSSNSTAVTSTSFPILKQSTTIVAAAPTRFPYELPMRFGVTITASFSGFITRIQYADAARSITATRPTNANGVFGFSSPLAVIAACAPILNSNQPTQSTTLAITGSQSSTALRRVFASASLPVTATISSTNVLAGFFNTVIDVVITDATSATEILFGILNNSQDVIANALASALRNARADASLAVAASRTPNVKWDAGFGSIATAVTATRSTYAVYSTDIVATTLPGFPYSLPMRFGVAITVGTSASASNRFTAPTVPTAVVAAISAAPRAGWSATPSLAVAFGGSQNANVATAIAANNATSASSTPEARKNIFISAISATITDTVSASSQASFYGSASLATSPAPTAENKLATVISANQISVSATSSPNSLRNVRVSPSLIVSGTFNTIANYNTTISSSRPITSGLTGNLNQSTTIDATTLPGFPYELPMRFGTTFTASLTLSMAISYKIATTLYVISESAPKLNARWSTSSSLLTTFVTSYPGFPYVLPLRLGLLNTTANTSTLFQASQTITPSTSSSDKMSALLSGTLSVSSSPSFSLLRDARTSSNTTAATVTLSSNQKLDGLIGSGSLISVTRDTNSRASMSLSASLGVAPVSSPTGLRNALVDSGLAVTVTIGGASLASLYGTTSLAISSSTSAQSGLTGLISSQTSVTPTTSFSLLRVANFASSLLVSGTLTSVAKYTTTILGSLATTTTRSSELKQSTTIEATTLPGFPYDLPMRFGVTVRASTSSALANNNTASVSLEVTADRNQSAGHRATIAASLAINFITNYPGLPYTLPFIVGRLNTTANIAGSFQASQTITPNASSSDRMAGLVAGSLSVSSGPSSAVLWRTRADSSLAALVAISAVQKLSGLLSSSTAVLSTISADSLSRMILGGTLGVTSSTTVIGLRNALVGSTANMVVTTSANKKLSAFASAALLLSVNDLTSVTEVLASVGNSSGEISASASAEMARKASASASLLVSVGTTPTVKWQAKFSGNLGVTLLATGLSKLSTTIDATTLPGFPYYLPMRFGVAITVSTSSTLSGNNTASASLAVGIETNQSLGTRTAISTSLAVNFITNYPGFPYVLPFKVGRLNTTASTLVSLQASQGITSSTTSSGKMAALLAGSLSAFSATSFSLLRNARVDSSLPITAIIDAAGKTNGILSSGSLISSGPFSSSRTSLLSSAPLTINSISSATGLRNTLAASSYAATAVPIANAVYSTPITAVLSKFPYYLPIGFGVVFRATTTSIIANSVSASTNPTVVTANVTAETRTKWSATPSLAVSSALTAFAKQQASCAASLPLNFLTTNAVKNSATISATTLPGFPYYLPMRFGVAINALTTATLVGANIASASLAIVTNRNQSLSIGTRIETALSINFVTIYPGFPYTLPLLLGKLNSQANVSRGINSSTPISFLSSASAKQNFAASASRQINVSLPADAIDTESMSAYLSVKSSLVPCFPYDLPILLSSAINARASMSLNQKFAAELQVNSVRATQLGVNIRAAASLVVNFVTTHQVIPYILPFLLGKLNTSFTLNRSAQSSSSITAQSQPDVSLGQLLSTTRAITGSTQSSVSRGSPITARLTVKNAIVPCFPYDLPILLSSTPNARASALRDARVDASLVMNAQRPTNIGILVKGAVSLAVSVITNYQSLPYTLPYLLGHLDTRASLSRSIQTSLSGQATGIAKSSQNQKFSLAWQITVLPTASGSRDALVSASLTIKTTTVPCFPYVLPFELNTVSVQQASAIRLTRASAALSVGVRGMDPTFMPGFPYMLPFRIGVAAPSPRMSLGTKAPSSTSIITTLSAELSRKLFATSNETITATTQSALSGKITFATYLAVGTTQAPILNVFPYELPYQFATYRSEPPRATLVVSSRAYSTTLVITARTYGFPYQLPIKLGPVNSVRLSRSASVQTSVAVSTSALLVEAGATLVSLPVSISGSASARNKAYISVNSRPGFPFTLPLLLQGGSFDITVGRAATLGFVRTASTQTSATAGIGNPSTLVNYSAAPALSIAARPTANANFSVALASSFAATVIISALTKHRINFTVPLTVSPISFIRMNFQTTISTALDVQSQPFANATFDTVLSAPLPTSTTSDVILSQASKNSASLSVGATRDVSGLRDTKASAADTNILATTSASMLLTARAAGPLTVTVSADVRTKEYGRLLAPLDVSSSPVAELLQRSAISAPSEISFITNTIENQSQRFSTTINSVADLLSVVTKDQKIGSPTSATLAGIFSSILRSVTATTQPVITASRPTTFQGDFFCGTQMGITAQPSVIVSWAAHADIPLNVTAGLSISASRGQFLVSVGTAVSAEVIASAEPYHSAGSFLPFFYAGSNFY